MSYIETLVVLYLIITCWCELSEIKINLDEIESLLSKRTPGLFTLFSEH